MVSADIAILLHDGSGFDLIGGHPVSLLHFSVHQGLQQGL